MNVVEGEIQAGEASGVVGVIRRRQMGPPWYTVSVLVIIALMVAGEALAEKLFPESGTAGVVAVVVSGALGYVLYLRLCRWMAKKQFRHRLQGRGLPVTFPLRVEVGDRLRYVLGGCEQIADWTCVSELFRAGEYWVFLAQSNAIFVPRRAFADAAAETEFLKAALARMSPGASALSPQAVAVAGRSAS
jgi:hypothetical protein